VDSDGQPDALTVSNASGKVEWYENNDGFSVAQPGHLITTLFAPRWAATGDVDNDGDTDAVVAALTSSVVALEENSGGPNPAFFERIVDASANTANQAIVGDFDNDGDLDIVAVTLADDTISLRPNLLIHRQTLLSLDAVDSPPSGGPGAQALLAVDLDRDSDTDLVVADSATGQIRLLRSQGSFKLTSFLAPLTLTTQADADRLAAADVDSDGDPDLIVASSITGAVQVHLSDGGNPPAFAAPLALSSLLGVQALATGDIDRDGDVDIVAAPTAQGDIVVYRNDGPGTFTTTLVPSGAAGSGLALADIDRDGDLDILTAGRPAPPAAQLRALLNDGSGVFSNQLLDSFTAASDRIALRPADFDNDGDVDILLTSDQGDSALLFESDGHSPPSFSMRTIASGLTDVYPLELADLDRDGDTDALLGSSWLENQGGASPSFAVHSGLAAPANAVAIAVADFDGEGDVDIAYASTTQSTISMLRNVGGQASLSAVSVAPASISDGAAAALLRVDTTHQGRAGDADAHLQSLLFRLDNDTGSTLTQGQASLLFDRFQLYADDGDGVFSSAQDALIADEPMQTLLLNQGRFTLTATLSDQTRLAPGQTRSYFLVAQTKPAASQQGVAGFRAVHPNDGGDGLIDAIAASPLLL
ncbi:MAG: VCBS repeat-containing protein, partial [Planctomycetota bacterium]